MQLCSVGPQRSRMRPRAVWTALAVVVALYGSRTLTRNRDWHDELTFCTRTLQSSPDAYLIRANLGTLYWNQGHAAAAEREWKQAYELGPSSVITLNNLGVLYTRQKRYVDAILYLQKAIALKPNYAQAHLSLGLTYQEMGLAAQAESEFRRAVELAPLNAQMRNYFGNFLFGAGRFDQAEPQFLRAAELDSTAEPYDRLGDISLRRGQTGRAEQAFLRAAQLNPFDGHAHIRLGALYASHGRIDLAVREYRAGLETDPANAEALAALRRLNATTTSPAAPPPAPPQ